MEKWLSELLDKIKENKELASNGKFYTRCPCCGEIDIQPTEYCEMDFLWSEQSEQEERIRPAVAFGTFIYRPMIDSYGECCWCQKCLSHFYAIHIKSTDELQLIMHSPPIEEIRNNIYRKLNPIVKENNIYIAKFSIDDNYTFLNKKLYEILTDEDFRENGKLKSINDINTIYHEKYDVYF